MLEFRCAGPLEIVNDDGLGGVVGGGIIRAMDGNGAVAGVLVGAIALVELAMFAGEVILAELGVDEAEIVMSGGVFLVEGKRFLELLDGEPEELPLAFGMSALAFGAFDIGLAEFIDDFVILA